MPTIQADEFMRLVLVVPMNGRLDDCFRVWETAGDGWSYYTVTDAGNNALHVNPDAAAAFSDALSRAAWGVRCRKATAKDYA
jgi:hypothetical protein